MESSEVVAAAADEFSGIDSGWTRYIGSPLHCEIYNDDNRSADMEEYNSNDRGNDDDDDDDDGDGDESDSGEDSDDSMASDASSGPSKLEVLCINGEKSHGTDQLKHADDGNKKLLSGKKTGKQVRKITYERKFQEEEQEEDIAAGKKDSMLKVDSVGSHV